MGNIAVIKAEKREKLGKGSSRALRRAGKMPAIIYGINKEEVSIAANQKEVQKEYLRGNFTSRIYDIEVGGEKIRVLPHAVQLHPITDYAIHADFLRVERDTKVHIFVPVHFLNKDQSPGLKRGGVLNIVRRQIELACRADSIPAFLEIDLTGIKIGESLHSHSIKYPEGVEPVIKGRDFTIATIVGQTAEEVEEEEVVAEGEEGAEGEAAEGAEGEAAAESEE